MADKNNQSNNIFQNLLDVVVRKDKGLSRDDQQLGSQATFDPRGAGSREEAQQRFLEWQRQIVANDLYERSMNFGTDRISAYQDYRAMDNSPEVSKALSIMKDECLTQNEYGEVLQIYSDQERVKEALKDLFTNRLNINEALSLWIREMLKWGDYFVYLHIDKDSGVMGYMNYHPSEVYREEGYGDDLGAVRFRLEGSRNMILEEWQMSHFRLIDDSERLPYGRSVLDPARKTWKQLQLAEDSMLVYRLCLAGDTRIKTDEGYKYIRDIREGDNVVTFNTDMSVEYTKVLHQVNNGKKKMLRVRSKTHEWLCTETHPILVHEKGIFHYVDAKDLIVKKHQLINPDLSMLPITRKKIETEFGVRFAMLNEEGRAEFRRMPFGSKTAKEREVAKITGYIQNRIHQFLYTENKSIPVDVAEAVCEEFDIEKEFLVEHEKGLNKVHELSSLPEYVDVDFGRMFGFLLGDGFITKNGIGFAEGTDEWVNQEYSLLLKRYFGKVRYEPDTREGKRYGKYFVSSTIAARVMMGLGYVSGAHNKRIPQWAFQVEPEVRKAIVLGFSDADGCERLTKSKQKRWFSTIEICNKQLLEDIKELWSSIGMSSGHISTRNKKERYVESMGRTIKATTAYSMTISELPLSKYENVLSVEDAGEDEVYDITVEHENHNFIANGAPVHNTRAPDRKVFYVEVGNLDPNEIQAFIQQIQKSVKKAPTVDIRNGQRNYQYNPQNVTEDYFMPVRGDHHSKIDTLPGACLALDTKICLLDGRSMTLNDIIKEYESGKQLWSYSIDPVSGKIVPGKITWAGTTRKSAQVVKLTLDNGETMVVTPDHKFPTKFNGEKEAKDLLGESLWSFNKKQEPIFKNKSKAKTYEKVYDHSLNDWVFTHQMVGHYFKSLGLHQEKVFDVKLENTHKNVIHHYDMDRKNNAPENLFFMNFHDHVMLHQSLSYKFKEERKAGVKAYFNNLTKEQWEERKEISRQNIKGAIGLLQERIKNDPEFKKDMYERAGKTQSITKSDPTIKSRTSERVKQQWRDGSIRETVLEKQTYKYSPELMQMVVAMHEDGLNGTEMLSRINAKNSSFMQEFMKLNSGNKQLAKMKVGFTHNNLNKMIVSFGYKNWRDFTKKAECFNHKVVAVEWLEELQDTGTLTIDGQEEFHNYHTFALDSQVFTFNSNMSDIQDIEYLENKLLCSLGVPKAYLNYTEGIQGGSTLSQADIRFARTINRFQEMVLMELRKIAKVHLFVLGFKEDFENFSLKLNNPSTQMELMKLEIMKARLEVGKEWFSPDSFSFASWTWVMENIMGFSKNDIKKILKQKKVEKKMFAEIDSAPETYRKTGIFKDIDQKYEMAGAPPEGGTGDSADSGGGDSGFGGSSALGGMDDGMGGGMDDMPDLGGDSPDSGGAPPAPSPSGPPAGGSSAADMALGESKIRLDNIIDELFEEDEETRQEKIIVEKGKHGIVDSGNQIMKSADSLFNKLEKKFGVSHVDERKRKSIIKEAIFVESNNNPLLDSYNANIARMNELNERFEDGLQFDDIIEDIGDEEDNEHQ